MRLRALLVFTLIAFATVAFAAEERWIAFSDDEPFSEVRLEASRSGAELVEFDLVVPGVAVEHITTAQGDFARLMVPGMGRIGAVGEPELPAFRRFVEIPHGATATMTTTVLDRATVDLAAESLPGLVYPVQLPMPKCDCEEARNWRFSQKTEAYKGVVGADASGIESSYMIRDHHMTMLTAAPVVYDVDSGTVEIATRLRVTVAINGGDVAKTTAIKQRLSSRHFDAWLADSAINLNMTEAGGWSYPDDAPVEFLIITPPQFVADLAPFVEWKTSTGYHMNVVTTDETGTSTTQIKAYIQGLYGGQNPPVYILMIGDSPSLLATYTPSGGGTGGTDLPYVQMDSDLYPDMFIARWPIDDATELANMRDKILHYQQPTAATAAWLNRALFLAGDDYYGRVTTHEEVTAQLMDPAPNSAETEIWYGDSGATPQPGTPHPPSTQDLIDALNTGKAWTVYSAHCGQSGMSGDPSFTSSDVPNLGNADQYPIGHGHCCQSNMWASSPDVFGEVVVTQADKGFVAYWGGSNSTYWDGDDWLEKGFFDALFDADIAGIGGDWDRLYSNIAACYAGLSEVTISNVGNEDYYWPMYNLNGDPSLDPFTRAPIALNVGAPPVVPPVADTFSVTVTDTTGPVPLAMVAVSQDGVLLGAGLTNDAGAAVFPIDAPAPGSDLLVRVTAHNHLPTDAATLVAAGSDGVVVLDRDIYRCDAPVVVNVFDEDLDNDPPFNVTLSAAPSGGSVPVLVADLGTVGVVQFQGGALLGTDLVVAHGDTLTVTYNDADTGAGPGVKTDTAVLDCAGPAIADVQAVATEASVTFSYTTDEPGTTVVAWGFGTPPANIVSDDGLAMDHSVSIDGVTPCTEIFYEIRSTDIHGNLSVDNNGGGYYVVETAGWGIFFSETFDSDPGWAIDNGNEPPADGWGFGQPTGQGQDSYGEPDPTSGATGPNVYGVNLNGDIPENLSDNELKLTTPVIDLSAATSAQLRYQRWLGVERDTYDNARIRLSTDGGATWSTVWENGGDTIDENAWSERIVDLSAAVGSSQVQIQWTYGSTDGSWNYCGWNIDDVVVEGAMPCGGLPMIFTDGFETGNCDMWTEMVSSP